MRGKAWVVCRKDEMHNCSVGREIRRATLQHTDQAKTKPRPLQNISRWIF